MTARIQRWGGNPPGEAVFLDAIDPERLVVYSFSGWVGSVGEPLTNFCLESFEVYGERVALRKLSAVVPSVGQIEVNQDLMGLILKWVFSLQ